jgi:hypothetical protein
MVLRRSECWGASRNPSTGPLRISLVEERHGGPAGLGDQERLEAVIGSGNSPQKHVFRARLVLLSAAGVGTMAIRRQTGKGKPDLALAGAFMGEGVDGLLHGATRPAGKPVLTLSTIEWVVEMTLAEPPGEATH